MGASKPRRGRPPLPLEGQRQRLLDAARQLLERQELETAGVRDVVAEAGMSSRAFYQGEGLRLEPTSRGRGGGSRASLAAIPSALSIPVG